MATKTFTTKTRRAIEKYGEVLCMDAFRLNREVGEGASTIGWMHGITTRQADAAINAGAEIIAWRRNNQNNA
jgi:hypothetical protein